MLILISFPTFKKIFNINNLCSEYYLKIRYKTRNINFCNYKTHYSFYSCVYVISFGKLGNKENKLKKKIYINLF